jgi:hypothetical protein
MRSIYSLPSPSLVGLSVVLVFFIVLQMVGWNHAAVDHEEVKPLVSPSASIFGSFDILKEKLILGVVQNTSPLLKLYEIRNYIWLIDKMKKKNYKF